MTVTEEYGVLVGRTLVDASKWSANELMVNPSSEVVVLPSLSVLKTWSRCQQCPWLARNWSLRG